MDIQSVLLQVVSAMEIKTLRKILEIECVLRDWSLRDVSTHAGVGYSQLSDWLNGKKSARIENWERVALAFGRDISWLFQPLDRYLTSASQAVASRAYERSECAPESPEQKDRKASASQVESAGPKVMRIVELSGSQSESSSTPAHPKAVVRRSKHPKAKRSGQPSSRPGAS